MKIALVCDQFNPNAGGLEQWLFQFSTRLIRRGHQVHVVTFKAPAPRTSEWPTIHELPWSANRAARSRTIDAALPAVGADIVHDTGVGCECDVFHPQMGSRLANYRRDVLSKTARERWRARLRPGHWMWLHSLKSMEHRQYTRDRTVFLAVSAMVARDLHEIYDVPQERIRLIPNGVDADRFTPGGRGPDRDEVVFLFAAHNPRLKGIRTLLRAMGDLRSTAPEARLVVIGKPPDPEYAKTVERLGIAHSVSFRGFVEDPQPYFAAADVFVLPTFYDACSLTVLEAWACGLPAITTRFNGAAELMRDGCEGYILDDPADSSALARAMAALTDRALRSRMSVAARELALRNRIDRQTDLIEQVYAECIASRTRK